MTTPPRSRAAGSPAVLIACVLIAAAAVAAAVLLPPYLRDGARREADAVARDFLRAATSGGGWQAAASPLLQGLVPAGSPLIGEAGTADALELDASYDLRQVTLRGASPETSDTASAGVVVHYRYAVQGEAGEASVPQTLWLTRPFYYGDGVPQRADPERTPSAIGPWRVTGVTVPRKDDLAGAAARSSFDLTSPAGERDDTACYSAEQALIETADRARVDGEIGSSCFLGAPDGSDVIAGDVDRAALLDAFPAIDETDPASIPPELTRVAPDTFHGLRAPFTQYLVGDFVVTFAASHTDADETATRLVSIRRIEGEK